MTAPGLSDAQLAAIRERAEAATPEPWAVEWYDGYITGHVTSPHHDYCGNLVQRRDSVTAEPSMTAKDAAFIAAARTDIPALLAEVTRLRAGAKRAERIEAAARAVNVAWRARLWGITGTVHRALEAALGVGGEGQG